MISSSERGRWWSYCWFVTLVLFFVLPGPLFGQDVSGTKTPIPHTWTDGFYTYAFIPPLEGYFVPNDLFKKNGYSLPLEKVLAASRKMTRIELDRYADGGGRQVTEDFPLFVFPNQGMNLFLWKGVRNEVQQVLVRSWDGESWGGMGLFYQTKNREKCYVIVGQQGGYAGTERINTDQIFFGSVEPAEKLFQENVAVADTVIFLPDSWWESKCEWMDCLKGNMTRSEWRKLDQEPVSSTTGGNRAHRSGFAFINGTGDERKIRIPTYFKGDGIFREDYGQTWIQHEDLLSQRLPEDVRAKYEAPTRWDLARAAFATHSGDNNCMLRVTNPTVPPNGWLILELSVGSGSPGFLYRLPQNAAQRDGGESTVRFEFHQGKSVVELAPLGRFGVDSLPKPSPEENSVLNMEYHFIDCGEGVLKLAIRPKRYPWSATVQARWNSQLDNPIMPAADQSAVSHFSEVIGLDLK